MSDGEIRFELFFRDKGLEAQRFSKEETRSGKTPDYKVMQGSSLAFYCEVKDIREDTRMDDLLAEAAPGEIVGYMVDDPAPNRVSAKIHEAVKQFEAVNAGHEVPNVLAFFNDDETCDSDDLTAVIAGGLPCEDGSWFWGYRRYSEGRIKDEKWAVDLYLWIEDEGEPRFFFTERRPEHHKALLAVFGIRQEQIRHLT